MAEKKKVFIAEDEEDSFQSLKKLLTMSNFQVEGTTKSKEIISLVKSYQPDIILLDMLMPNLGGLEICEMLNNDKEVKHIPIIIISALGSEADIKKAYQLGVVDYITKPYDYKTVVKKINKFIAYKQNSNS